MLMDILATALAFIAVILLLSLVVTGLTQFVTASLRLRVLNLRRALGILINDLGDGGRTKRDLKPDVSRVIDAASFGTTEAPKDMIAGLGLIRVSWIKSEDLIFCLKAAGIDVVAKAKAEQALQQFKLLEAYMEKRFALFARYISFTLAFVVAIVFQVSSPYLLHQLWTDADLRARYVAVAESLNDESKTEALRKVTGVVDLQALSVEALAEIAPNYPDEAAAFEEFSGKNRNPTDARDELAAVLAHSPQKQAILDAFEDALQKRLTDAQQRGTLAAEEATARLATLDITPWKGGAAFYRGRGALGFDWGRLSGVLLTALLLTFGAPFWYARLRDVVRLRDTVSGKTTPGTATQQPQGTPSTPPAKPG